MDLALSRAESRCLGHVGGRTASQELCQRNLRANTGLDYREFAELVRLGVRSALLATRDSSAETTRVGFDGSLAEEDRGWLLSAGLGSKLLHEIAAIGLERRESRRNPLSRLWPP